MEAEPDHILKWPSSQFSSFQDAVITACESGNTLFISSNTQVFIKEIIVIKINKPVILHLCGESASRSGELVGTAHSIFKILGRRTKVVLENLTLSHVAFSEDKREIGAAIFGLNSANISAINCDIRSSHGFCVWTVQNAQCSLSSCRLSSPMRSGCVAFGKSSLAISHSIVKECGQHGICLRGDCSLFLDSCIVDKCLVRAIYAYDRAHVSLTSSRIQGTVDSGHAALELRGQEESAGGESVVTEITSQGLFWMQKSAPSSKICQFTVSKTATTCSLVHLVMKDTLFMNNSGGNIRMDGSDIVVSYSNCYYYCPVVDKCVPFTNTLRISESPWDDILRNVSSPKVTWEQFITSKALQNEENLTDAIPQTRASTNSESATWEFQRNDVEWISYPSEINSFLNKVYSQFLITAGYGIQEEKARWSVQLPEPFNMYSVELGTTRCYQVNTSTFFTRSIRRVVNK